MSVSGDLIIHVGLQKTGTTFLQQCVFPAMKGVKTFRHLDIFLYKSKQHGIALWSDENLSGMPHLIYDKTKCNSRYNIAVNLKRLFPNAHIIVGIRNPDQWLKSLYQFSVSYGMSLSWQKFYERFDKDMLDFVKYIDMLKSLFNKVHVYHFEELKGHPDTVIKKMADFIQCKMPDYTYKIMNPSLTNNQYTIMRLINKLGGRSGYNSFKGISPVKDWVYTKIREPVNKT